MLRKHIHQKHKQEKHVVCEYCGQSFFYNNKLHIHIDRHHPGVIPLQFQCELCHKGKFFDCTGEKNLNFTKKNLDLTENLSFHFFFSFSFFQNSCFKLVPQIACQFAKLVTKSKFENSRIPKKAKFEINFTNDWTKNRLDAKSVISPQWDK